MTFDLSYKYVRSQESNTWKATASRMQWTSGEKLLSYQGTILNHF